MRISTLGYSLKQGLKNIWRNKMFSIASVATMAACIFLFGLFFAIVINFTYIMRSTEQNVSILVYFQEGIDQATIDSIGEQIAKQNHVIDVKYVSADEAWEQFAPIYFGDDYDESLASAFLSDNPLANSARYEVYVDRVENQDALVEYIKTLNGVNPDKIQQAEKATDTLSTFNKLVAYISVAIILVLLAVAIFLISNTVAVGISIRKEEIGIMKLIGATNTFVKAPFVIEGILLGAVGAAIPLAGLYFLYNQVVQYVMVKFNMLNGILTFLPANQVFRLVLPVGLILGVGIGLLGSLFTIRKHLKV